MLSGCSLFPTEIVYTIIVALELKTRCLRGDMHNLEGLSYRDQIVVLTGGCSAMVEATARPLGELGAQVHIVDIWPPKISCASFTCCDLSNFADVRKAASALKAIAPIHFVFPAPEFRRTG